MIILAGYADFQYAQTAIKYRVTSFILNPTNKKELFAAVQEAQKQLIVSSPSQENIAKEGVFFLKDQLMQELTDHLCTEELKEKLLFPLGFTWTAIMWQPSSHPPMSRICLPCKKIVIEEKKNTYCYRYNNLILNVYFQNQPSAYCSGISLENCREISGIVKAFSSLLRSLRGSAP